jgi:hypothetical protein
VQSTERLLEDDVDWADLIVMSMSSSTAEVLFAGVPVFVQITPEYEETAAAAFVSDARRFFRAEDLSPKLARLREDWARDPNAALAPERAALTGLFGDRREPVSIEDALRSNDAYARGSDRPSPHGAQTT